MKNFRTSLLIFLLSTVSWSMIVNCQIVPVDKSDKSELALLAQETRESNSKKTLIDLIQLCEDYLEYWNYQKTHVKMYLLSKGKIKVWGKSKQSALNEIDTKITSLEDKKRRYANLLGQVVLSKDLENYSHKKELDQFKGFKPPSKIKRNIMKCAFASTATVALTWFFYRNRKSLSKSVNTFYKKQISEPLKKMRNYLVGKSDNMLSGVNYQNDLLAQKNILYDKIRKFDSLVNSEQKQKALQEIISLAKDKGVEGLLHTCLQDASKLPLDILAKNSKSKTSLVDRLVGLTNILDMPPKVKFLEVEIKGLITRLAATKMMADVSLIMNENKLTLILAPLICPVVFAYLSYKGVQMLEHRVLSKKKKQIMALIVKIKKILSKNVNKNELSHLDQGMLVYFTHKLRSLISVVPKKIRGSFKMDLDTIDSFLNTNDQKLQALQCMQILLYSV